MNRHCALQFFAVSCSMWLLSKQQESRGSLGGGSFLRGPPLLPPFQKKECLFTQAGFSWLAGSVKPSPGQFGPPPEDCDAGFSNWHAGWSASKKAWCCEHTHRGCVPVSLPYDCNAGDERRGRRVKRVKRAVGHVFLGGCQPRFCWVCKGPVKKREVMPKSPPVIPGSVGSWSWFRAQKDVNPHGDV